MLNNAQERDDDEEGLKMLTIKDFPLKFEIVNAKYMYSVPYILALFLLLFFRHIYQDSN